jgi:hypothetical protein
MVDKSERDETALYGGVEDHFSASVKINGRDMPANASLVPELYICTNAMSTVPTLDLMLRDPSSELMGSFSYGDAIPIEVKLSRADEDGEVIPFRLIAAPDIMPGGGGGTVLNLACVYDSMKWWRGLVTGGAKAGTASEAIKTIAQDCELKIEADTTNDSMSWLGNRMTNARFAHFISDNSWFNEESCMMLGLGEDGLLQFVDLTRRLDKTPEVCFYYLHPQEEGSKKTAFNVVSLMVQSRSGMNNVRSGYGAVMVHEQLDGTATEYSNVTATRQSNVLDMNKEIKDQLGSVLRRTLPFDCGNMHENWGRARYQNERLRGLYSTGVDIQVETATGLKLFQLVELKVGETLTQDQNLNLSGYYFVMAKTRYLQGGRYGEKIKLVSSGRAVDPLEQMV